VRAQFALTPGVASFATWLFASHPRPVRDAIERHRRGLDSGAKRWLDTHEQAAEERVLDAAARYLNAPSSQIALTDSTTMGLALLYGGLKLRRGDVVLTSEHDFYATHESLRLRAQRDGVQVRRVQLYSHAQRANVREMLAALRNAIGPRTRVLALTWVHSSTGVKLPVREIAALVRDVNRRRRSDAPLRFCLDGVHGLGVEAATPEELGCDALVSGCHKWLFGPRGTGMLWASDDTWSEIAPTIPSFDRNAYGAWLSGGGQPSGPPGPLNTPGGYHSFEHRWALAEAFRFQQAIGKQRIESRTHVLARELKAAVRRIPNLTVITPLSQLLSAGIVCIDVHRDPQEVVERLRETHGIVASVTPYRARYLRLGPSILNSEDEVERAVRALRAAA
jgi:selenocysteine lyase/cysteine desulfurase